ncbi:MAG TPA: hypothetical protein VHX92_09235 [Rhizomicrobium sp.]|nr:hypothetical protein [Rhizomicrobium sp.]
MAAAMLNTFGGEALQRASDNAHIESLVSNEAGAASWRRVMVMIRDLLVRYCDSGYQPYGGAPDSRHVML